MKRILRNVALLSLCFMLLASFGCDNKRMKGLVPARGVVTFNGEPVAGAMIMFTPVQIGTEAVTASTTTDEKGAFKMTTVDPGDGVFPGEYYVTIVKDEMQGGMTLEQARLNSENPDEARKQGPAEEATVVHHLPVKYADMNTTDLRVTVPADGLKDIAFTLEGEVDLTPQKQGGHAGRGRR
ncbi:MAG: carboxypeptidase regulatory-like domain-containing protein [Thermoguttaceae bacterium]|nr:carboxypeptidase regulatory-like domain-containing protein [Thermoguttaceae bacterium]